MKGHSKSVASEKKESPRNKERLDRLWMQWCKLIILKDKRSVEKESDAEGVGEE